MDVPDLVGDERTAAPIPSSTTDLKLDLLANHLKVDVNDTDTREELVQIEEDEEEDQISVRTISSSSSSSSTRRRPPSKRTEKRVHVATTTATSTSTATPQAIENTERYRKIELLRIFQELDQRGIQLSGSYNMDSRLEDMEQEYEIVKSLQTKRQAVKLYKGFLMNAVHAVEFLNETYNPFDFHLQGWSENVSLNIDDFDDVFAELFEKYKGTGRKMEPELKLMLMLVMSASTFHAKNTLLNSFQSAFRGAAAAAPPPVSAYNRAKPRPSPPEEEEAPAMKGPDPRAFLERLRSGQRQQPSVPPPPEATRQSQSLPTDSPTTTSTTMSPIVTTSRRRKKPMTINI